VLLSITPPGDITLQEAVLLAHRNADLRADVGHTLRVLFDPPFPQADSRADIQHALHLDVIPAREFEDETRKSIVLGRAHDARVLGFIEPVVVVFVETPIALHEFSLTCMIQKLQRAVWFARCGLLDAVAAQPACDWPARLEVPQRFNPQCLKLQAGFHYFGTSRPSR
jgi:hypothetical protein